MSHKKHARLIWVKKIDKSRYNNFKIGSTSRKPGAVARSVACTLRMRSALRSIMASLPNSFAETFVPLPLTQEEEVVSDW